MELRITPSEIDGRVVAPPSKSDTHRAIACAALAEGTSFIRNALACDDTEATARACRELGVPVSALGSSNDTRIQGSSGQLSAPKEALDCGGSGTTIRFFTAIAALAPAGSDTSLTGNDSLNKRPVGVLLDSLASLGVRCSSAGGGKPPITVSGGGIPGGKTSMRGDVSSQFLSALLLACPNAKNDTTLTVTNGLQSKPYVSMTIRTLKQFGIHIESAPEMDWFSIPARQAFTARSYNVEGDYSSAAFLLAAGALAGKVHVENLRPDSLQGDSRVLCLLQQMGGEVKRSGTTVTVSRAPLRGMEIDASDVPDLVPVLAALATQAHGETRIVNAQRLRLKESDRLTSTASELSKMGARIAQTPDGLLINGPAKLHGACIGPHNDHRIAMACAVAALVATGETVITNAECVEKSYPSFARDIARIGAGLG